MSALSGDAELVYRVLYGECWLLFWLCACSMMVMSNSGEHMMGAVIVAAVEEWGVGTTVLEAAHHALLRAPSPCVWQQNPCLA